MPVRDGNAGFSNRMRENLPPLFAKKAKVWFFVGIPETTLKSGVGKNSWHSCR
jgi:hypothetical protein